VTSSDNQLTTDTQRLQILKDLAEALNEATDVSEAMAAILPRLSNVLGLSTAWAFRYDPDRSSFVEVGASGLPPALACNDAAALKDGWCECQEQFVAGRLNKAVNIVRCSRLRDAAGDKAGLVYHASIPLRSKGKPLGILNVAASGHSVFTEPALQLLSTIGHNVAVAVDRAGILADERHRAKQLKAMSEMAAELVSFVQPRAILQFAVTRFVEHLGYESCGITVGSPDGQRNKPRLVAAAHRLDAERQHSYSYKNFDETPLLPEHERILLSNTRSVLVRQIPHSDYFIRLESQCPNSYRETDEDLLSAFAWHLAAALENARLYQQSLDDAKWAERRKLAADLHDAVSQRLFSALLLTRTAKLLLQSSPPASEVTEAVAKVERLIADSQQEMRDLIHTLRPPDDRSFFALVRERVAPLQLHGQTRIHLTAEGAEDIALSFEQREALLKVVDEALHNTLKHAQAKNAYIHILHEAHRLAISIRDDGVGFDETTVSHGLGTTTMYERMHHIGGSLRLLSQPGKGTEVVCELPLRCGRNALDREDSRKE
jgi:signal transduction histidine kinase